MDSSINGADKIPEHKCRKNEGNRKITQQTPQAKKDARIAKGSSHYNVENHSSYLLSLRCYMLTFGATR